MRRPLDRVPAIKLKLGLLIVLATALATTTIVSARELGASWAVAIGAGTLVALVAIQALARGMTSPLREMALAARAMASGDYSKRVRETSHDEVGELARSFNRMASELAEVDRFRRDLVANASHELRTPITALQAVLENLIDGVEEPDRAALLSMHDQVDRLGKLVAQLLDLSKLEAGAVPLERRRFELEPLVRRAAKATTAAPSGEVDLRFDVTPGLVLEADPERVHQVLVNLLSNAIAHSPHGGVVEVRAERSEGVVRIEVSDEGPGIPAGESQKVFERFYRTDAARSSVEGGTGLGLAIARWIVDLHGGDIRVATREPHGCRMIVDLPGAA